MKVLGKKSRVNAVRNWWGVGDPIKHDIVGLVAVKPLLPKPIDFNIIE